MGAPGHKTQMKGNSVDKIFIVDDHAIFREGLRKVISDTPGMEVANEAGSGPEALQKILGTECMMWLFLILGCRAWEGLMCCES